MTGRKQLLVVDAVATTAVEGGANVLERQQRSATPPWNHPGATEATANELRDAVRADPRHPTVRATATTRLPRSVDTAQT